MRYQTRHEWDFPPTRRWRYYRTVDSFYQPSGWNAPIVRKVINVYWAVTITAIKMLIAIPLTIMLIGSIWLLAVIISLYI